MDIDKYFFTAFGPTADEVDWENPRYFEDRASSIASSVIRRVKNLDLLIEQLSEILEKWEPELVMYLVKNGHLDWFDSDEDEALKIMLKTIILEIKSYQMSLRSYNQEQ